MFGLKFFLLIAVAFGFWGCAGRMGKTVDGEFTRIQSKPPRNLIVFVADGLRHELVTAERMPALNAMVQAGVRFSNTHSLFPTLTMANSSGIATGHLLAETGVFGNVLFSTFPIPAANNTTLPFLEDDAVLSQLDENFENNLLSGETLLSAASQQGFLTAAIGKQGPILLQALPNRNNRKTLVVDDQTGSSVGAALPAEFVTKLKESGLGMIPPSRGANAKKGDFQTPGTLTANEVQQQYFADVATKVVLPEFKAQANPFVMVYWSRDPDGSQHYQGDSLNKVVPGINGPTSMAAVKNADNNLRQILTALKNLGLAENTDILVLSDHGFSTISRESKTSYSATLTYPDVPHDFLPPGFLAIDLAKSLGLNLYDTDRNLSPVNPSLGQHSAQTILAKEKTRPEIAVASNGGSDLIYLFGSEKKARAGKIISLLLREDYVSGIFIQDELGSIPGTLPLSAINLKGASRLATPTIVVSFRSYSTGCSVPTLCGVTVRTSFYSRGREVTGHLVGRTLLTF